MQYLFTDLRHLIQSRVGRNIKFTNHRNSAPPGRLQFTGGLYLVKPCLSDGLILRSEYVGVPGIEPHLRMRSYNLSVGNFKCLVNIALHAQIVQRHSLYNSTVDSRKRPSSWIPKYLGLECQSIYSVVMVSHGLV